MRKAWKKAEPLHSGAFPLAFAVMLKRTLILLAFPFLFLGAADVVETRDGARLVGTITGISDGVLNLQTSYAGTLEVKVDEIATFSTENPLFVRLETGDTLSGVVQTSTPDSIRVRNEDGSLASATQRVVTAWTPGERDPAIVAREAELLALQRKWSYQLALNLLGSGGNTSELGLGFRGNASLDGPDDNLRIYGRHNRSQRDGTTTQEESVGGVRYDSFLYRNFGWYTRVELENDRFRNLDLRSTAAAGLSYRFINQDHQRLVGRVGAAYRHQSYTDGTSSDEPTIDFSFSHRYTGNNYWKLTSELTVNPSLETLSEYLVTHSSILEIPLPDRFWTLGLGVTSDYNNRPRPGVKSLDYTWFASLILNFN